MNDKFLRDLALHPIPYKHLENIVWTIQNRISETLDDGDVAALNIAIQILKVAEGWKQALDFLVSHYIFLYEQEMSDNWEIELGQLNREDIRDVLLRNGVDVESLEAPINAEQRLTADLCGEEED